MVETMLKHCEARLVATMVEITLKALCFFYFCLIFFVQFCYLFYVFQ